jgi:putative SOS response-associated peptidase YedK
MCGRFTRMLPWPELVRLDRVTETWERQRNHAPAYNVAPTDPVPFVAAGENGAQRLREGRWWRGALAGEGDAKETYGHHHPDYQADAAEKITTKSRTRSAPRNVVRLAEHQPNPPPAPKATPQFPHRNAGNQREHAALYVVRKRGHLRPA